jgi:4-oxalocrotonate tautomerase
MPQVQITMLAGRTPEQKRRLAKRITDAMEEEAGARREAITISFVEVPAESYSSGGILMSDKKKTSP